MNDLDVGLEVVLSKSADGTKWRRAVGSIKGEGLAEIQTWAPQNKKGHTTIRWCPEKMQRWGGVCKGRGLRGTEAPWVAGPGAEEKHHGGYSSQDSMELGQGRARLMRKRFFTERVVGHWKWFSGHLVVMAPSCQS